MQQRDESTPGGPIWPTHDPGGQQDVPEYRPPAYSTSEYPTQSAYPTLEAGHMSTYGRVRSEPPEQRRGSSKLVAGVSALALLVGGAAGGVGGYLVADSQQSSGNASVVNALEQEQPAKQTATAPKGSVEAVAAKVTPSVVQLQVEGAGTAGEGSGFVLTDDGFILTNNHVVQAAADGNGRIRAIFADGRRANVSVVGRDPTTDVAVVKAEGVDGLVPVELGRSDDLRVGQAVVAIGSPFELSGTVTSGIISALNRPVTAGGEGNQATAMDAVQTDAAINPGNSGGPLVNMQGRVIGINSAIYSPRSTESPDSSGAGNVGIGFAIPIDQAKRTAEQLMKTGKATTTYIGANVQNNPDGGASIIKVLPNSPAEKAGLKAGDVVTKMDDRPIDDADELVAAIRTRAAGEKVTFTVDGNRTVEVTLGVQPAGAGN